MIASTDSKILETVDVGSFKGQQFKGEKIPFLTDILKQLPSHCKFFVEIKCGPEIIPYLTKEVNQSAAKDRVVFISFRKDSLIAAKKSHAGDSRILPPWTQQR